MPPIGWALGGLDFSNFFLVLKGTAPAATLKAAQDAGDVTINYGVFINAVINFAIVAIVKRSRTLRLWRDGHRRKAEVVDVQKSALAPRSAVLRCTVPDSPVRPMS